MLFFAIYIWFFKEPAAEDHNHLAPDQEEDHLK